jgi:hypothetical protein
MRPLEWTTPEPVTARQRVLAALVCDPPVATRGGGGHHRLVVVGTEDDSEAEQSESGLVAGD